MTWHNSSEQRVHPGGASAPSLPNTEGRGCLEDGGAPAREQECGPGVGSPHPAVEGLGVWKERPGRWIRALLGVEVHTRGQTSPEVSLLAVLATIPTSLNLSLPS